MALAAGTGGTKPVTVLHLLHDARRSGVPAVAATAMKALAGAGVAPVALFAYDGAYAEELRRSGIEVHTFGPKLPFVWRLNRFLFNLRLLTLARRADVVHVHSIRLAFSVLCARWLGVPVVYHLHELPDRVGFLLRRAMLTADRVVFCSRTCEAHFAGVPAREKRLILNAVSLPEELPVPAGAQQRPVIVMLASLNRGKGQDILLEAFARLPHRDAELRLYGTTGLSAHKYVHDLKRFVASRGLAGRVLFPGPTREVPEVLRSATLLVHTSRKESFGMALVEAMACGVPVIANDLGGMREVVRDGETGFLVAPGDTAMLAERIARLLDHPELRERMGRAGRQWVSERFGIEARLPEYLALYAELRRERNP